jgi:HAD superfamily hydrolase (TIGR01484 family)
MCNLIAMKLLSTDFDGTIVAWDSHVPCDPAFAEALEDHVRRGGLWAINTGRSLPHVLEGLSRLRPPVPPHFLLTDEREVWYRKRSGWVSHGPWNETCRQRHEQLFQEAEEVFALVKELNAAIPHFTILYDNELPTGLVGASEEVMDRVAEEMAKLAALHPDFGFQRNSIYLRFCHRDYHKGSALAELCRLEGLTREDVLAAGDNLNDLSMLDGKYAALPACPANALSQVKETVRAAGGYVAGACFAAGVAEAMRYFASKNGREGANTRPALENVGGCETQAPGLSR